MYSTPMIRLELENMKQTMITALSNYNEQISASVEAQLQNIVETFDYERAVVAIAGRVIEESIHSYFEDGEGRKIVEKSVEAALNKVFNVPPPDETPEEG